MPSQPMPALRIFDTDSHIVEPPDLWTSRLPASWNADRVMHIEWSDSLQCEAWCIGGKVITRAWYDVTHNWEGLYPNLGPTRFADSDPANYDLAARIVEMNKNRISKQVLYPNIGGFYYDPFVNNADTELSFAHLRAYNDFLLDWSEPAPDRFVPLATIPYWNIDEAIRELHRIAATHAGVVMSGAPHLHESPYLGDPHWDPLWDAITEVGLPISFHVANAGVAEHIAERRMETDGPRAGVSRATTSTFLDNANITNDLIISGVLARHPELKFVIVESGIGWVPFVLESADYHFKRNQVWKDKPEFRDSLPSDLFRRQVYVNYWFETLQPWHVDIIGEDHILFETDFPHPTHLWGDNLSATLDKGFLNISDAQKQKILWGNAVKLYGESPMLDGRELLNEMKSE